MGSEQSKDSVTDVTNISEDVLGALFSAIRCRSDYDKKFDFNLSEEKKNTFLQLLGRHTYFQYCHVRFRREITSTAGCKCDYYGHECQTCYECGRCVNSPSHCSCDLPTHTVCVVRWKRRWGATPDKKRKGWFLDALHTFEERKISILKGQNLTSSDLCTLSKWACWTDSALVLRYLVRMGAELPYVYDDGEVNRMVTVWLQVHSEWCQTKREELLEDCYLPSTLVELIIAYIVLPKK